MRVLGAYPYYPNNPWQRIVYGDLADRDVRVKPLSSLTDSDWADFARSSGEAAVLHVNWTGQITQPETSVARAMTASQQVISNLEEFQRTGGKVVWTVHNVLPHEIRYLAAELVLCRALASLANQIVIINPDTAELTRDWYEIPPGRTTILPHPSYIGEFTNTVSPAKAKAELGVSDTSRVFLLLGTLRPYKGLEQLVESFEAAHAADSRLQLLVAGEPGPGYTVPDLKALLDGRDGLISNIGYVEDDQVQFWCNAADVMVLPYRDGLNISLVELAASFSLPAAVRPTTANRHLISRSWVAPLHEEGRRGKSVLDLAALAEWLRVHPQAGAEARAHANTFAPNIIAANFADVVERTFRAG